MSSVSISNLTRFALLVAALAPGAAAAEPRTPAVPATVGFNRDVRPIMSNTCFKCHGPDVKNNKSDLRLDLPEVARAPHKNAKGRITTPIVPGKLEQSEVWRRVSSKDPGEAMPPADSLHQLSERNKAVFRRWIEQGAKYEPHWSYLPPVKAPVPGQAGAEASPIDRFVRAELAARNVSPSPAADRRTLIRRVSLDLTGLPPTPAEVAAFVADARPGAYERVVDRLLASEHYGERMAVPWLDLVRFADSVGFHGDQRQNIFPYRDYVIAAFNRNKPFDQFTREQLAGDLLPNATEEQRTATGYNRLNMMTREGGAQAKEYLAKYAADRVRTVATTFLGSTLACAECHDHKFDPFATRDFYSMAAYFADIKQWGVYSDYRYTPEPELAGYNNDYPFPPELEVANPALQRRLAQLRTAHDAQIHAVAKELAAQPATPEMTAWTKQVAARLAVEPDGRTVATVESIKAGKLATLTALPDHTVRFANPPPDGKPELTGASKTAASTHTITLDVPAGPLATVRLEALTDETAEGTVTRDRKRGLFTLTLKLSVLRAGATKPEPLEIADAYPDGETEAFDNAYRLPTLRTEWNSARTREKSPQAADYLLRRPLTLAAGDRLIATVMSFDVARLRFHVSPLGGRLPGEALAAAEREAFSAAEPTIAQREAIAAQYFLSTGAGDAQGYATALDRLRDIVACYNGRALTMVTVATTPMVTRVLARGNWQDEKGEVVSPAPPGFLTGAKANPAPRATRLDLANWITSRENPLTARAYVNRLWKQFFGTGLSAVVDDLGMQGEYPSHPELLDWLAVDFMERGWDTKAMVRLMVTSATYRQSSVNRPELREIDPQNRLLARQSARRLDAEFVRDNALYSAGLLNLEIGGPSATPYQPEGYYAQLNFPLRDYHAERDERQYRRGVYTHWQRTFLHPMLANFDAPSREECTAARTISNTPQQALTLLNDPTFVEAARTLAERVLLAAPGPDFAAQLNGAFLRVLARPPTPREVESLRAHHEAQLAVYRAAPADARKLAAVGLHPASPKLDAIELAAWTSVARVVLNLNEAIVVY